MFSTVPVNLAPDFVDLLGEGRGLDAVGDEQFAAVDRLLEPAGDLLLVDREFDDFLLIQQLQKLAVGDHLDRSVRRPYALEQHKQKQSADEVPDVPLVLLVHRQLSRSGVMRQSCGACVCYPRPTWSV